MSSAKETRAVPIQARQGSRNLAAAHKACFQIMSDAIASGDPLIDRTEAERRATNTIAKVYHEAVLDFGRKENHSTNVGLGSLLTATAYVADLKVFLAAAISFAVVKSISSRAHDSRLIQTKEGGDYISTAPGLPRRSFDACRLSLIDQAKKIAR